MALTTTHWLMLIPGLLLGFAIGIWFALRFRDKK